MYISQAIHLLIFVNKFTLILYPYYTLGGSTILMSGEWRAV